MHRKQKGEFNIVKQQVTQLHWETWGVLTIYTNHPGGNLVHKHKTIKFDMGKERPATMYIS